MKRLSIGLVALAAAIAVPLALASGGKLKGDVGPGFTIHLKTSAGTAVKTLKAGKYTIVVTDKSDIHNFDLFGNGLHKATSIGGTGTKTWIVTLKPGTYKFICDVHPTQMHGSFKVTS